MKKQLLQMFGVFCLGVATVPGVLIGARFWQDANGKSPKFVEIQRVDAKAESNFGKADAEFAALDELEASARTSKSSRKLPATLSDEGDFEDFSPSIDTRVAKPAQVIDLEVEPPELAQNSPIRKPAEAKTTFDGFDAPAFRPSIEAEPVRGKPRSTAEAAKAELPDGIESLVEAELSDEQKAKLTTLREKLAELTKAKAELVNEQTLEETIFSLEKQISNLHAAQKLLSAQQILRALAEEFPDSPAAAKAQRMLEAAETKKSPKPLKPVPDSFDEEPARTTRG